MVGLVSMLLGEVLYEAVRFIIMLILLVVAAVLGGKLKERSDAKKAKKAEEASVSEQVTADNN